MTWTVSRNNIISGANTADRAKGAMILIKDKLQAAAVPWTVVKSGTGTGGSYGAGDLLPTYPSISGVNSYAWVLLENTEGVQVIIQYYSNYLYMFWAPDGGYESTGDEDEDTRPGDVSPPTTEVINVPSTSNMIWGLNGDYYLSVATEDSGTSFIVFGKYLTYASAGMAIIKLNTPSGDLHPYWGMNVCDDSDTPWGADYWESYSTIANARKAYHPTAGGINYGVANYKINNSDAMDNMPANPYTGEEQLMGLVAINIQSPHQHVKGGINGIMRCPGNLATGAKLNSGELIVLEDFVVPWGSAVDNLL